jgi:hypothetical protein
MARDRKSPQQHESTPAVELAHPGFDLRRKRGQNEVVARRAPIIFPSRPCLRRHEFGNV